ncbi:MAG: hypothetical protein ABIO05_05085, partial [Ferruginibacter sp.]
WGWGAFAACIAQFILKVMYQYPHHYLVWLVTFVCGFITIIIGSRQRKKEKVNTYVGESMRYVWSGLGITFFVISVIFFKIGYQYCFPFFIMLYGLGTFVSGQFLKYKPLILGGLIAFGLAIITAWLPYDYQLLATALALLVSYIIPGHLLRQHYQQKQKAL